MQIARNRLYSILLIACLVGYAWMYFSISNELSNDNLWQGCLIKHATNLPCPSCGSTRSVISLTQGHFLDAFQWNPFGYLIAVIMLIAPIWIVADMIMKRNSLYQAYQKIETFLRQPRNAVPLILLIVINWIWNITKGL